jgi:tetratricopeptide (TPR) repeat protein
MNTMTATGLPVGVEVVAIVGIGIGEDLAIPDLAPMLIRRVIDTGRADIVEHVLFGLWQEADEKVEAGEVEAGVRRAMASLKLAVEAGNYHAAATALTVLASCHEADGRPDAKALCLLKAARVLARDDQGIEALAALEASEEAWNDAGWEQEVESVRVERLELAESLGEARPLVDILNATARRSLDRGDIAAARRAARRALAVAVDVDDPAVETAAWRALAEVLRAAGESDEAEACEARVELLEGK